jgi:hypothetical protein
VRQCRWRAWAQAAIQISAMISMGITILCLYPVRTQQSIVFKNVASGFLDQRSRWPASYVYAFTTGAQTTHKR